MDSDAQSAVCEPWLSWTRCAAEALAARLRAGGVPRMRRAEGRALLSEAFAALGWWDDVADRAPSEPPSVGRLRALAYALDRLATPPVRPIPEPTMRSILRTPGAVDRRRVNRIVGYWEWAEGLGARRTEFLARAGFEAPMSALREVVEGSPPASDRTLTEG